MKLIKELIKKGLNDEYKGNGKISEKTKLN